MGWSDATLWWLAAGALVAVELATGTFYLLMVSLGCVAGAMAAHAGFGITPQLVSAALLGGGATAGWHLRRSREPGPPPAATNRDVNLDIGQTLQVAQWEADGSARVRYRGALWNVRAAAGGVPQPGEHTIVAVQGSSLTVAPTPRG